ALDQPAPPLADADARAARVGDPLDDRADHGIEAGAVATAGQDSDSHGSSLSPCKAMAPRGRSRTSTPPGTPRDPWEKPVQVTTEEGPGSRVIPSSPGPRSGSTPDPPGAPGAVRSQPGCTTAPWAW